MGKLSAVKLGASGRGVETLSRRDLMILTKEWRHAKVGSWDLAVRNSD